MHAPCANPCVRTPHTHECTRSSTGNPCSLVCTHWYWAVRRQVLGVEPLGFWADREPAFVGPAGVTLPGEWTYAPGPPNTRYRGWFPNDEDLLGDWSPDPMGNTVFSLATWDKLLQAGAACLSV